jgi:hypothetical protein
MTGHFTSYENRTDHKLTTGVAAPVAASVFYGQTFPVHAITAAAVFWGTVTLILHAVGQFVLGGLRRD